MENRRVDNERVGRAWGPTEGLPLGLRRARPTPLGQ